MRIAIGGFLVAHGLMHGVVWILKPNPNLRGVPEFSNSWLIGSTRTLSAAAAGVVALTLVFGGVALFAHAPAWRPIAVAGLAGSLLLDVLYFTPWLSFITIVNATFLIELVWVGWPSKGQLGA